MSAPARKKVRLKRAYDAPSRSDGYRVLVERLWPRGVAKERLRLNAWLKDLSPSAELRKWFNHDPAKWPDFRRRYYRELDARPAAVQESWPKAAKGTVTLVFAAKDLRHNNAVALKDYLERRRERSRYTSTEEPMSSQRHPAATHASTSRVRPSTNGSLGTLGRVIGHPSGVAWRVQDNRCLDAARAVLSMTGGCSFSSRIRTRTSSGRTPTRSR